MTVVLKDIDFRNWVESARLEVKKEQTDFIFRNIWSLANSKFPGPDYDYEPLAIYKNDIMVGFVMWNKIPQDGLYQISRIMIDKKYQAKGYGKAGLKELIKSISKLPDCKGVWLDFKPNNVIAQRLYEGLGFHVTGITDEFIRMDYIFRK
jgi:diamine N-acetyltransferase